MSLETLAPGETLPAGDLELFEEIQEGMGEQVPCECVHSNGRAEAPCGREAAWRATVMAGESEPTATCFILCEGCKVTWERNVIGAVSFTRL